MIREELLEQYKNYPEIIFSPMNMTEPNTPIKIFEGEYLIRDGVKETKIIGLIIFDWLPNPNVHFSGKSVDGNIDLFTMEGKSIQIIINGLEFGNGVITNININGPSDDLSIKGLINQRAILGDSSIAVNKLSFSVPNLRSFSNKLTLENEEYIILLVKCSNYEELEESLKEKGGYIIQYRGELTSKKGAISFEEVNNIFFCLNIFLGLLNGRRTSAYFINGIYDNKTIWCDFTDYLISSYKSVQSWPQTHSIKGLDKLWQKFSSIWKDSDNKNFLNLVMHWYNEANCESGYSEGSIIMAQTALELLYNWWIIENKKLIRGKDSENISASNKIRLLLSQLNILTSVPRSFKNLQSFIDANQDIIDAPEAVVQIRNAIVHSQEEKRKKLSSINTMTKYEALQVCIWYIEMALLRILEYNDKYYNRCADTSSAYDAVEYVPWYPQVAET